MIRIEVVETANGFRLTANGHANYAPAGQDIVCAGVSAILCTLAQCVLIDADEGHMDVRGLCMDPGAWLIEVEEIGEARLTSLHAAIIGLLMIEKGYPHCVKLTATGEAAEGLFRRYQW